MRWVDEMEARHNAEVPGSAPRERTLALPAKYSRVFTHRRRRQEQGTYSLC